MRLALDSRERALQALLDRAARADVPEDVKANLYVFSIVQICGYIERSMDVIIIERLKYKAQDQVLEFVKSYFKKGTNFKCPVIKSFLERFDTTWARKMQDYIDQNEDVKVGVDSAYALRNQAAHGQSANIGGQRAAQLFAIAKRLVEAIVKATE